jgi:DNA-binding Xre family transcriptional regulator
MIRFRLKEIIANYQFETGSKITFDELAKETGVNRTTLLKIANHKGYNTVTDNIGKLCDFFGCTVSDIMEHIPSKTE